MEAFYYVDGDPLKGQWIDLENINDLDDVREVLAEGGWIPRDEDGNPDYGGDLLVADVEGDLPYCFMGRYGSFDLDDFIDARDSRFDLNAIAAFIYLFDEWNAERFSDNYLGVYDSPEDYAYQYVDDCGLLDSLPKNLRCYFDYEKFASDLMINDITEHNGYYFYHW
ncbi:antirestriction protein ArdA [Budviciaceae bacterium CWB-B4]|uniref:Antirestriction protein ArdA n=1 Tax=Limnobaculum xujianqingii TaxID=2738837 RepID=A0A9D7FQC4_9GAMM|nr:antirestriction protein ArdA [Limnobaculum xujianqingii]MBK5071639.1 antirestriction protein ArdA [Limnobaculum xujianqingii]MBK5174948.1 antirestriction protein ArdA [Limnobaculum xujianqingii]